MVLADGLISGSLMEIDAPIGTQGVETSTDLADDVFGLRRRDVAKNDCQRWQANHVVEPVHGAVNHTLASGRVFRSRALCWKRKHTLHCRGARGKGTQGIRSSNNPDGGNL